MNLPTIERLRELFIVRDGKLINAATRGRNKIAKAGDEAGTPHTCGYREVNVDGRRFLTHRVVFAIATGHWPDGVIDHINGDRLDNRPENLRECTQSQNLQNMRMRPNNTSGAKGVSWSAKRRKWIAQASINGKQTNLGRYNTIEEAKAAHDAAVFKHHGEFARTS